MGKKTETTGTKEPKTKVRRSAKQMAMDASNDLMGASRKISDPASSGKALELAMGCKALAASIPDASE